MKKTPVLESILYLFFGVMTTAVNIAVYAVCSRSFRWGVSVSTVMAWILSVLFAFITNRLFVFHSEESSMYGILKETALFFSSRLATGFLDVLLMNIFAVRLAYDDMMVKVSVNIIIIILNYILSKWVVFKKGKKNVGD